MPYLKQELRKLLDEALHSLVERVTWSVSLMDDDMKAGVLNYLVSVIAKSMYPTELNRYRHYNEIIGALECAKLEYYRRLVSKYEDKKIEENGDVY